jgi:hypothetical protein
LEFRAGGRGQRRRGLINHGDIDLIGRDRSRVHNFGCDPVRTWSGQCSAADLKACRRSRLLGANSGPPPMQTDRHLSWCSPLRYTSFALDYSAVLAREDGASGSAASEIFIPEHSEPKSSSTAPLLPTEEICLH